MSNRLLAARVLGVPLLIASSKLDAILSVLGPRLGLDLPAPTGPAAAPKSREPARVEARIATVQVVGTLGHRVDAIDAMSGMTSYETLGEELDRLAADDNVDGILLEVDSFGGEAAGCFDAADRIRAARAQKPVVGVASQYAMSAGYALLSQCDRVFVPQTGEVGSIGVVTTHVDVSKATEAAGVVVTHIYAGAHKVDGTPFAALSPEASTRLAGEIATIYDQFVGVVAQGRGAHLSEQAARDTEALTFMGAQAVETGLADEVGDKAAALASLRGMVEEKRHMKDLQARLASVTTERDAALARIAEVEKRLAARDTAEDAAYLESLKKRSADAQNPIDAAKLAKVKAHLDGGRREIARELGDELLEGALKAGGKPVRTQAAAPEPDAREAAVARGVARLEARAGGKKNKPAPAGARKR